jgi:hypothetical protein
MFGKNLLVCCPHPEMKYHGEKVQVTGHYVILGIRDFLMAVAKSLREQALAHHTEAERLSGSRGLAGEPLLDRITFALGYETAYRDPLVQAFEEESASVKLGHRANIVKDKSLFIADRSEGFLVEHRNGESKLLRYLNSPFIRVVNGIDRSSDVGTYHPVEPLEMGAEVPDSWFNWQFASEDDNNSVQGLKEVAEELNISINELMDRPPDSDTASTISRANSRDRAGRYRQLNPALEDRTRVESIDRSISEGPQLRTSVRSIRRGGLNTDDYVRVRSAGSVESRRRPARRYHIDEN